MCKTDDFQEVLQNHERLRVLKHDNSIVGVVSIECESEIAKVGLLALQHTGHFNIVMDILERKFNVTIIETDRKWSDHLEKFSKRGYVKCQNVLFKVSLNEYPSL